MIIRDSSDSGYNNDKCEYSANRDSMDINDRCKKCDSFSISA